MAVTSNRPGRIAKDRSIVVPSPRVPYRLLPTPISVYCALALNEDPDESVAELVETEDEGLVYDSGDPQPQRQLRLRYLERHTWTNPQSGTVIEFEVPREDVVWMPVAMQ